MEASLPEVQKSTSFWWFIPLARANVNGRDNTRVIQPPNIFQLDQPVPPIHLGEGISQFTLHVLFQEIHLNTLMAPIPGAP